MLINWNLYHLGFPGFFFNAAYFFKVFLLDFNFDYELQYPLIIKNFLLYQTLAYYNSWNYRAFSACIFNFHLFRVNPHRTDSLVSD